VTGRGLSPRGLSARPYAPEDRDQWDELAASARTRHFMFQRDYMEYHADRFTDASLLVVRGGRPRALFPATRHGGTVISHGGLTFGGMLSGSELTTLRTMEAVAAVSAALRAQGVTRLIYKPVPHIYHLAPAEEELYALHESGARLIRRDVSSAVPPTTRPESSRKRRHAAEQAWRSGVSVAEDGAVEPFMELVARVLEQRHGVTVTHTPAEMRWLADRFPRGIRLFTARVDDEMVAGALVFETPMVAHTQYIAASPRGRELSASDAVLAHLIEKRYPDRWFDFGISNEPDGSLNEGLAHFKEGFGARAVLYDRYELDLSGTEGPHGVDDLR
jgi:hypothetical protein